MYMSRFSVKNYKCLVDIDIPLTPIHVLIGENDSGKTSLLEAMAALYTSWEKGPQEFLPSAWQDQELVFHGSGDHTIEIGGQWSPSPREERVWQELRYDFTLDFSPNGHDLGRLRRWVSIDGERKEREEWTKPPRRQVRRPPRDTEREIPSTPAPIKKTADLDETLKPTSIFSLDPRVIGIPAGFSPNRRFQLDSDGFGLPTLLDDILGYDVDRFVRLRDEFCRSFPQFKSVRLEIEQGVMRHPAPIGSQLVGQATGKGIHFEMAVGGEIRAQLASDGVVLMLAFLALAHVPDPPRLLLLEEPENGIYPKRLEEAIQLLKSMVERTEAVRFPQIILSTHSPYVLSFFEPEEVTFLSRDLKTGGVRARPMRDAPNIKERLAGGAFYLGELWYNLSEEELFGDA